MFRKLLDLLSPVTVCVVWDGRYVKHHSWARSDALEWLSCYPVDASVFVYNRMGLVATRRPS